MTSRFVPILALAVVGLATGAAVAPAVAPPGPATPATSDAGPRVVTVVARGLTFHAPDTVPAGWTTFRFDNQSEFTHFAVVERMPEGIGVAEQQAQAAPVFQQGMDLLREGKNDEAMAKFGELPEWFGKVVFMGGPGLTAPGHVSRATVRLEPGTYVLECYVKTNGTFHSYNPDPNAYGMVHQLTVVPASDSATSPPTPTATLTLSSAKGIELDGAARAGSNTFEVRFADQKGYPNFVGHDVHLVRLAADTDVDALLAWMDWTRKGGLSIPAPAEFVGGLNEMPAGSTGYLSADLAPGRYAFIAEVPAARDAGFYREFAVE